MGILKVAIIDDGVNPICFRHIHKEDCLEIKNGKIYPIIDSLPTMRTTHGTICAQIIRHYIRLAHIRFFSLRILDPFTKSGNIMNFKAAVNWCIDNEIDIVNCSLGSIEKNDITYLSQVVEVADKKGVVIIGAMNNHGVYTVPACLPCVIGVRNNIMYANGFYKLKWYPLDDIEVEICGEHIIQNDDGIHQKIDASNSFAAPVITAKIADILSVRGKISRTEILKELAEDAKTVIGRYIHDSSPYTWNQSWNSRYLEEWSAQESAVVLNRYLQKLPQYDNAPLVIISGTDTSTVGRLLETLYNWLSSSDYRFLLLSQFREDKMIGDMIIIPNSCDLTTVINNFLWKFNSDIAVVHAKEMSMGDLCIFVSDTVVLTYEENGYEYRFEYKKIDYNIILKQIQEILT